MERVKGLDSPDPVIEAYKQGVDQTLFDRNLQLTPTERLEQLQQFVAFLAGVEEAGGRRQESPSERPTD